MRITRTQLSRIIREEITRLAEAPRKQAKHAPVAKRLSANTARPMPSGGAPTAGVMDSPGGVRRQIVGAASSGTLRDKTIERRLRSVLQKAFPGAKPGDLNVIMNVASNASMIKSDIESIDYNRGTGYDDCDSMDDPLEATERDELESDLDDEIEKLHGLFDRLMGKGDFAPKIKPSGPRGTRVKGGRSAARR